MAGGPLVKTHKCQYGSLAAELSLAGRGPLFADGDAFDRGIDTNAPKKWPAKPP